MTDDADVIARLQYRRNNFQDKLAEDALGVIQKLRLVIVHEADCTEAADDEVMRRGHEIERLRAALTQIRDGYLGDQSAEAQFVWAQGVARAALQPSATESQR